MRIFGLGGEFGVIWPAKKVNVLVRMIPELGAGFGARQKWTTSALDQ
jgi:hypothetical protein